MSVLGPAPASRISGPSSPRDTAPPGAAGGQKALGVKVEVTKTPQTYLLGVMGQSMWTVNTTATVDHRSADRRSRRPAAADRHGRLRRP